jgi:hypothetical protein
MNQTNNSFLPRIPHSYLLAGSWLIPDFVLWQHDTFWTVFFPAIGSIVEPEQQAKREGPPFDIPGAEPRIVIGTCGGCHRSFGTGRHYHQGFDGSNFSGTHAGHAMQLWGEGEGKDVTDRPNTDIRQGIRHVH